jgi:hypothetical protein
MERRLWGAGGGVDFGCGGVPQRQSVDVGVAAAVGVTVCSDPRAAQAC